jgi:hypothetical protein
MMCRMIILYPGFNPLYHSFYLYGLFCLFGMRACRFSAAGFPLKLGSSGLAFIYTPNRLRIFIDTRDTAEMDEEALTWADVYGKVNLIPAAARAATVVPLGPSFGVSLKPFHRMLYLAFRAAYREMACQRIFPEDSIRFFWLQCRRASLDSYRESRIAPSSRYIFSASSVWAPDDPCNSVRALFFSIARRYCAAGNSAFEGGFTPPFRGDAPCPEEFRLPKRYAAQEYLQKTQASVFVFNTPAVLNCHGWKLGEYLALGKAILSTPLSRELPAPLEHGLHLHIVAATEQSISEGMSLLLRDHAYRRRLERSARGYYLQYLAPERVIQRLTWMKKK